MSDEAPVVALTRRDDGVAVITLQNPKVNAISSAVLRRIAEIVAELEADLPGAVVLTGNERFFAAGADISEFSGPDQAREIGGLFIDPTGVDVCVLAGDIGAAFDDLQAAVEAEFADLDPEDAAVMTSVSLSFPGM